MKKIIIIFILCIIRNYSTAQWTEQVVPPSTPALLSVSAVSFNVCWASGINGTVLYTSNGGLNWVNRSSVLFLNKDVNVICGFDSLTAVCAITITQPLTTVIFRTSNAGNTWQPVYIQPNGNIRDIKMYLPGSAYAYGDPVSGIWTFLGTSNSGATFFVPLGIPTHQIGNEVGQYRSMATSLLGLRVWFGTSSGRIYRSFTGGLLFIPSNAQFSNIYSISFATNELLGFAGGNPNAISMTLDGGLTWLLQLTLPGTGDCNAMAGVGLLDFWYSKNDSIYRSMDAGLTFLREYISPVQGTYRQISFTASLLSDEIESTLRGWGVTDHASISVYDGPSLAGLQNGGNIPDKYSLSQNYPNPFNPTTIINYQLPKSTYVKLQIYDEIGRLLKTLVKGNQAPGSYKVVWDASDYHSGIYFYKLQTETFTETRKMILLK